MASFLSALLKAARRNGAVALVIAAVAAVVIWIIDQYAGNHVTDFTVAIAGVAFVCFCAFVATRDEVIRKLAEFAREPDVASLQITWRPGESVFVHSYQQNQPGLDTEFRICVTNTSSRTTLTGIRVRLQELRPHELPCVPCGLRLMNNTVPPFIERFDLHPKEDQFISVFVQNPRQNKLYFLHTTLGIPWDVPAQTYKMKIVASCGPTRAEQQFEILKNGLQWEMRAINA